MMITEGSSVGRAPSLVVTEELAFPASNPSQKRVAPGVAGWKKSRGVRRIRTSNTTEGGGSSPSPRTILIWAQDVGLPECPYLRRWVLDLGFFAIRLHRWQSSDDGRAFHDHPWWFVVLVLKGSYVDESPESRDRLRIGYIRFRRARHRHTVNVQVPGTWTLLITGRPVRRWGFWVNGKLIKRDKYFAVYGHHHPRGDPIRIRPDGFRIERLS